MDAPAISPGSGEDGGLFRGRLRRGKSDFLIRNTGTVIPGALEVGAVSGGPAGYQTAYTPVGTAPTTWNFHTANPAILP